MNRFEKRLLLAMGLLILGLALLEAMAPRPTDWSWSFSRFHRTPYGARYVYERLTDLFPEAQSVADPPLTAANRRLGGNGPEEAPVNHVFVNDRLAFEPYATERLLALVERGDHAFLAAHRFGDALADTLRIGVEAPFALAEDTSDIRFIGEPRMAEGVFRFARGFPGTRFTRYDTARTRVVAVDGASRPVLLHMAWGKGRIVLCSAPLAFTNYNLLKDRNADFAAAALSLLPPRPVRWDEYLKDGRQENRSFFRFALSQPALKWALFLAQGLLVLFLLVHVRRLQRAIPVIDPPRNATRELARTIGRLYWHRGDHAGIARKLIAQFKGEMRARAYLAAFAYDEATAQHMASKGGLPIEEMRGHLAALQRAEHAGTLSESELLALSRRLHALRERMP